MKQSKTIILKGKSLSVGIAIGRPFFLSENDEKIIEKKLKVEEVDHEIDRYHKAIKRSIFDLKRLQDKFFQEKSHTIVSILEAHIVLLNDPQLKAMIEKKIRRSKKNSEYVFQRVIEEYSQKFYKMKNLHFRERVQDIVDVSRRVIQHLQCFNQPIQKLPDESILIAKDLIPSHVFETDNALVGFISSQGGVSSHAAIIARTKKIPYVTQISIEDLAKKTIKRLLIDGYTGQIIINPNEDMLKNYDLKNAKKSMKRKPVFSNTYLSDANKNKISFFANVNILSDLEEFDITHTNGIGLCRSEYLFLEEKNFPDQERQLIKYCELIEKAKDLPMILRLFDFAKDKSHLLRYVSEEMKKSSKDYRGINFLLKYPKILKEQISAILRASIYGDIRILIPFVSDTSQIIAVKKMINEVQKELDQNNIPYRRNIYLGSMIEVPSCALIIDELSELVDFFSIGTNDLSQHLLGIDRERLDEKSMHPALIRFLYTTIQSILAYKKQFFLCGEVVANPEMSTLLVAMGAKNFSSSASHLDQLMKTIANMDYDLAKLKLEKVLKRHLLRR